MQEITLGGNTKRSRFPAITVQVPDFNEWPKASQEFVIAYGLRQYLADGMAGANDETDAKDGVADRVRKIKEADFSRSNGGGGTKPDTEATRALKLAREFLRDQLKALGQKADAAVVAEAAAKLLEGDNPIGKKLKAEAKRQIDAEAKARAETKEDAGGTDLLSLLGLLPATDDEPDEEPEGDTPHDEAPE